MFQLKKGKEAFTVVEGPFAKKTFKPGDLYAEIPQNEAGRFQEIKKAAPAKAPAAETEKPAKAESKKAGANPSSGTDFKSVPPKGGGKS